MDKALKVEASNKNHEKKKRSTEIKSVSKENSSKKTSEENQNTKNPIINWKEEKEIIKEYLHQEYPLTNKKIDKIIEGKREKYIDRDKYRKFFFKFQSKKLMANIKKSKNLSKAPRTLKSILMMKQKKSHILQIK